MLRGIFAGTASFSISPIPDALLTESFCTSSNSSAESAGLTPTTLWTFAKDPSNVEFSTKSRTKPSSGLIDFPNGTRTRDPIFTESWSSIGTS